jgi:hypothetical protein
MLASNMPHLTPIHWPSLRPTYRMLGLSLLLSSCAATKAQIAVNQPQQLAPPTYSGTIAAIRPVSSSQDPTGSLRQIMSILGQTAPQPVDASEIVIRMPDDTIKTSVQPPQPSLMAGNKAVITAAPDATIQPY